MKPSTRSHSSLQLHRQPRPRRPPLAANLYSDATGPLAAELQGEGNRLQIVGSAAAFAQRNRRINPAPAAEFFGGGTH